MLAAASDSDQGANLAEHIVSCGGARCLAEFWESPVTKATTLAAALALGMAAWIAADRIAMAQAGSIGGTIGKQDKSVSGVVEQPTTYPPAESYWDHNGSRIRLTANGADRKFVYENPRIGMVDVGVKKGTVLFSGKRMGDSYVGSAFIFTPRCGAFEYPVVGIVSSDNSQVILHGRVPTNNGKCEIIGYKDDTLVFTYQGH
jgi:hypothetical protein